MICASVHDRGTEQELTTSVKLHVIIAFICSGVALAFSSVYESRDYEERTQMVPDVRDSLWC